MSEYKRDLGLKESVAIVISRIIGSGIFPNTGTYNGSGGLYIPVRIGLGYWRNHYNLRRGNLC